MTRQSLAVLGLVPVLLVGCGPVERGASAQGSPKESEVTPGNSEAVPIKITCIPVSGLDREYRGSAIGGSGEHSDGDEFTPFMVLKDERQEVLLRNVIYDVYVQQAELDPDKEYTFEVTKNDSSGAHRITRIMDGETIKYETLTKH